MAATFTFTPDGNAISPDVYGNDRVVLGVLNIAGTYTAAGDALAASDAALATLFGLSRVDKVVFLDGATTVGAIPQFIEATRKLIQRGGAAAGALCGELTAATNVAGSIRVMVYGK